MIMSISLQRVSTQVQSNLEIRFNFELGNTERTLVECEFVMVGVVDVIEVNIELEEFSGSIFSSLTSTTST